MVATGQPITQADMDALAALANDKLDPAGLTPPQPLFKFNEQDTSLPAPTYCSGAYELNDTYTGYQYYDNKVEITVFAYKTDGTKIKVSAGCVGASVVVATHPDLRSFTITWDWPAVMGADGYYVVRTVNNIAALQSYKLVTTNGFVDDNSGYSADSLLWLFELQRIYATLQGEVLANGITQDLIVSPKQCVCINPRPSAGSTDSFDGISNFNGYMFPARNSGEVIPPSYYPILKGVEFWFAEEDAPSGLTVSRILKCVDGTVITLASSSTMIDVVGLHPTSAIKKIVVPDVDPATILAQSNAHGGSVYGGGYDYFLLSDTEIAGVWIAKTPPTPATNTLIHCHLPNYCPNLSSPTYGNVVRAGAIFEWMNLSCGAEYQNPSGSNVRSGAMMPSIPDLHKSIITSNIVEGTQINAVEPSIPAQPAFWTAMRDTDSQQWFSEIDGLRSLDNIASGTLKPTEKYSDVRFFAGFDGLQDFALSMFSSPTPYLPIYVSNTQVPDPLNPSTYDFIKTDGAILMSDLISHYGTGFYGVYFCLYNNTDKPKSFSYQARNQYKDSLGSYSSTPAFFPLNTYTNNPRLNFLGVGEAYSYCLEGDSQFNDDKSNPKPIPQRGQCITSVLLRRTPVEASNGILLPATKDEDLETLEVKLGVLRGSHHKPSILEFENIVKGSFVEFQTFTIPQGEVEARFDVFWPVVGGVMLAYQCQKPISVQAECNFQPMFFQSDLANGYLVYANDDVNLTTNTSSANTVYNIGMFPRAVGYKGQTDNHRFDSPCLRFVNQLYSWNLGIPSPRNAKQVQFPMSATVYNDIESALNLL